MSQTSTLISLFLLFPLLPASPSQPNTATILPSLSSPTATIPAFPEQSAIASACPLDLPTALSQTVSSSCSSPLHRSRCCPTLAAWLYSAYAPTALSAAATSSYDLPVPPDDSETCAANIEKVIDERGVKLARPNETCDLVYCYCGIRLHPLRCPQGEEWVGNETMVGILERECRGGSGIGACNNCLHTLYQLKKTQHLKMNKSDERVKKMQNKDCELMGLTWLLAKNRSAYIYTVTSVLRALMMNTDGQDLPRSCSIDSDGMPLAVDSSEINGSSSSIFHLGISLIVISFCMLYLIPYFDLLFH